MKNFFTALFLFFTSANGFAQSEIREHTLSQMVAGKPVQRSYWTYVPESVAENPALVVVMHGYSGSATGIEYSGMNTVAEETGFIVAILKAQWIRKAMLSSMWVTHSTKARQSMTWTSCGA